MLLHHSMVYKDCLKFDHLCDKCISEYSSVKLLSNIDIQNLFKSRCPYLKLYSVVEYIIRVIEGYVINCYHMSYLIETVEQNSGIPLEAQPLIDILRILDNNLLSQYYTIKFGSGNLMINCDNNRHYDLFLRLVRCDLHPCSFFLHEIINNLKYVSLRKDLDL